jgi:predicted DsbA family dithiol-disulfide isomerase
VLLATRCALASAKVTAIAIEASEFPGDADRHGVHGVPAIVVDDRPAWVGSVPEPVFVERLVHAASSVQSQG